MMKKTIWCSVLTGALLLTGLLKADEKPNYGKGVFILNEDWFGHQNSTINYLREDGTWEYRVFQKENAGKELGCTSQFGTIYNGRMYIVSKQARDMGATITGGRLTVCDAQTMACIKQIENLATDNTGKSVADGRGFVGINSKKGYVSTSNGIYVLDLEKIEVGRQIPGTGSESGGLYSSQCGMMICLGNKVLAIHQKKGLLIIDAENDTIERRIGAPVEEVNGKATARGFGSIVQAKDSSLWLSVAGDITGRGNTVDYFFRLDHKTFDTLRIELPAGYGLPNSWYAWTADAFCASPNQNKLYWKKKSDGWYTNSEICCYDIDKNECTDFFDAQSMGWYMYCGAGFRICPQTEEMYVSLYQDNFQQTYQTIRLDTNGKVLAAYEMIDNYWFPAMPIFPAVQADTSDDPDNPDNPTDPDNPDNPDNPDDPTDPDNPTDPTAVEVFNPSFVAALYPNPTTGLVYIELSEPAVMEASDLFGRVALRQTLSAGKHTFGLAKSGLYILRITTGEKVEIKRIIKR